jgi:hypothetical protein
MSESYNHQINTNRCLALSLRATAWCWGYLPVMDNGGLKEKGRKEGEKFLMYPFLPALRSLDGLNRLSRAPWSGDRVNIANFSCWLSGIRRHLCAGHPRSSRCSSNGHCSHDHRTTGYLCKSSCHFSTHPKPPQTI